MMSNWKIIAGIVTAGIVAAGAVIWLVYFHTPEITPDTSAPSTSFGAGDSRSTTGVSSSQTNGALPVVSQNIATTKIFKITDGPVAGATLISYAHPTSTVARFVMAANGHVFDFTLDSQGTVPKSLTNTTIPGIAKVIWSEKGKGVLLQYLDGQVLKTAHVSLPFSGATSSNAVHIQFLPTGMISPSVSPDGASVAYLSKTTTGVDGYIATADGAGVTKLFSLPLSQVQLSWPAPGTLLAQTAPGTGIGGMVFSIDTKTGAVTPLIYAEGITATADRAFNYVVYQTAGDTRSTYAQNIKSGLSAPLSFDPIPELCSWNLATSTSLYCASPLAYVDPSYLDLLHLGAGGVGMSIVKYNLSLGAMNIVAIPGSSDGGEKAEIAEIALSPADDYLLFIRKGDRSLWGVRLKN